jgi:hypothetical protein
MNGDNIWRGVEVAQRQVAKLNNPTPNLSLESGQFTLLKTQ